MRERLSEEETDAGLTRRLVGGEVATDALEVIDDSVKDGPGLWDSTIDEDLVGVP